MNKSFKKFLKIVDNFLLDFQFQTIDSIILQLLTLFARKVLYIYKPFSPESDKILKKWKRCRKIEIPFFRIQASSSSRGGFSTSNSLMRCFE